MPAQARSPGRRAGRRDAAACLPLPCGWSPADGLPIVRGGSQARSLVVARAAPL